MSTIQDSGTQVATLTTLHTLATITDAGTYLLRVDTAALANGETLELEIHGKVGAGGASGRLYLGPFTHAQADPIKDSLAVVNAAGRELVFKLRQTGGVSRSFPWEVHSL